MVTECVAILAISLCLVVVFIRAGHGDYAASVTPILAVPGKSRNRKNKKLYVVMLGGYNIILTCTFVHRTLAVLWK